MWFAFILFASLAMRCFGEEIQIGPNPSRVQYHPQGIRNDILEDQIAKLRDFLDKKKMKKGNLKDLPIADRASDKEKSEKSSSASPASEKPTTKAATLGDRIKNFLHMNGTNSTEDMAKECKDYDENACKKFAPFCNIFSQHAFYYCKKTCKMCKENNPKGKSWNFKCIFCFKFTQDFNFRARC